MKLFSTDDSALFIKFNRQYGRQAAWLSIMLLGLILSGCAHPTIDIKGEAGPNNLAATKLRRVAVLPFQGPDGDQATQEFESMLAQANIKGSAYFNLSSG